jgi:hypothetical protein
MNKTKILLILFLVGIVLAVLASFLLTAGRTIGQTFFGRSYAESQLRDYVKVVLKQDVNGARCQSIDTDGNGYVACDYTTVDQPSTTRTLECASWSLEGFLNRGCKARLPGLP